MDEILQYTISTDARKNPLDGGRNYKLHLPPNIPVCNFWSLIVYDVQTHLMIQTEQSWPSVHSNCKKLLINPDGSVDVWLGPYSSDGQRTQLGENDSRADLVYDCPALRFERIH